MKFLSVCSGIEAASVAWNPLGWEAVGFSEIEKFPSKVLAHHYPNIPNFGDMTNYKQWSINEPINLLVGGTPCQSFSVAGLRKGLEDPRGNLALAYVGILDHFRPEWFVWENVPGVLSSGRGRDFGSFLGAVVKLGYGFAYRVLDAQYFGVPQRRRRVFVVGCSRGWEFASKVLFESESLQRNTSKSRTQRQTITTFVESSFGQYRADPIGGTTKASGGVLGGGSETFYVAPKAPTLLSSAAGFSRPGNAVTEHETYIGTWAFEPGIAKRESNPNRFCKEISPTLRANMGDNQVAMANQMAVRRLTPIECERLQGFPDNYTNVPTATDTPRYKALGNSMAVPVMRWIGNRIKNVIALNNLM